MHRGIDDTDIQILNILQKNARIPVKELAKKINLFSPVALGMYTKAFICLEVAPVQKQEFYPYTRKCKHVVECNCVTGEYSMLLEVLFENTMELDQFIGELQRFGRTKTLIVFSTSVEHRGAEL